MDRFLSKAKDVSSGEWVVGYFYYDYNYEINKSVRIFCKINDKGDNYIIDIKTLCQCARSDSKGQLWENDYFWSNDVEGIIGVITWSDDDDTWMVREVPNTVEDETVPDFEDTLNWLQLNEFSTTEIMDNFIGNIHD